MFSRISGTTSSVTSGTTITSQSVRPFSECVHPVHSHLHSTFTSEFAFTITIISLLMLYLPTPAYDSPPPANELRRLTQANRTVHSTTVASSTVLPLPQRVCQQSISSSIHIFIFEVTTSQLPFVLRDGCL